MLKKEIFISGFSSINPADNPENSNDAFRFVEPDYKKYLDLASVRRLGRIQKASLVAAKICLENACTEKIDSVITGTGLGCLTDTDKFLNNMLEDEQGMHSPTSFIQSTHNTLSGQIAIMLKCHGHNNTFSHKGLSFERALEDAMLLLEEEDVSTVLVCAADEVSENAHLITQKINLFYSHSNPNLPVAGEGVHCFVINKEKLPNTKAKISGFNTQQGNLSFEEILLLCHQTLFSSGISAEEVDALILGTNPLVEEQHYHQLKNTLFDNASIFQFKNLIGESFTASGFGMVLACQLLSGEEIDHRFYLKNQQKELKTVLIYNQFEGISHSFILLQNV